MRRSKTVAAGLSEQWLRRCAWCDRMEIDGRFTYTRPLGRARITHTICPDCLRKQLALRQRPAA